MTPATRKYRAWQRAKDRERAAAEEFRAAARDEIARYGLSATARNIGIDRRLLDGWRRHGTDREEE